MSSTSPQSNPTRSRAEWEAEIEEKQEQLIGLQLALQTIPAEQWPGGSAVHSAQTYQAKTDLDKLTKEVLALVRQGNTSSTISQGVSQASESSQGGSH
jgi:hypothetical protein